MVELPDGLRIIPGPLTGATVECYADHRMATFGAIVGLRVPGVSLSDVGATSKTLPDFPCCGSRWSRRRTHEAAAVTRRRVADSYDGMTSGFAPASATVRAQRPGPRTPGPPTRWC